MLKEEDEQILLQMAHMQRERLLKMARRIVPTMTSDDVLQPNDFPDIENNPVFRYEEGYLAGIDAAIMALRAKDDS